MYRRAIYLALQRKIDPSLGDWWVPLEEALGVDLKEIEPVPHRQELLDLMIAKSLRRAFAQEREDRARVVAELAAKNDTAFL
jgi:hypothetical protein